MKLSGIMRKQLHHALLDAFPNKSDMERFLSFHMNESLSEIANSGADISDIYFRVIKKVESTDSIDFFVAEALTDNPNNKNLKEFQKRWGEEKRGIFQDLKHSEKNDKINTLIDLGRKPEPSPKKASLTEKRQNLLDNKNIKKTIEQHITTIRNSLREMDYITISQDISPQEYDKAKKLINQIKESIQSIWQLTQENKALSVEIIGLKKKIFLIGNSIFGQIASLEAMLTNLRSNSAERNNKTQEQEMKLRASFRKLSEILKCFGKNQEEL